MEDEALGGGEEPEGGAAGRGYKRRQVEVAIDGMGAFDCCFLFPNDMGGLFKTNKSGLCLQLLSFGGNIKVGFSRFKSGANGYSDLPKGKFLGGSVLKPFRVCVVTADDETALASAVAAIIMCLFKYKVQSLGPNSDVNAGTFYFCQGKSVVGLEEAHGVRRAVSYDGGAPVMHLMADACSLLQAGGRELVIVGPHAWESKGAEFKCHVYKFEGSISDCARAAYGAVIAGVCGSAQGINSVMNRLRAGAADPIRITLSEWRDGGGGGGVEEGAGVVGGDTW